VLRHPGIATAENHWEIVQEETFAPLLYIIGYDKLDDALRGCTTTCRRVCPAPSSPATCWKPSASWATRQRLRHRQREHRHQRRGDRRRLRRREGNRRRPRERLSDAWKAYMRRQTNTINWSTELPLAQGHQVRGVVYRMSIWAQVLNGVAPMGVLA
jgi:aldehyde dehydrogenase (NAD+)